MDDRARRAEARRRWSGGKYALGTEPSEDLSKTTTPEERLSMMWELAVQAWAFSGKPIPAYDRKDAPGRIIRPGDE